MKYFTPLTNGEVFVGEVVGERVEVDVIYFFGRVTFSSIIRMVRGVGIVFALVVYVFMTPLLLLVVPEFTTPI